MKKLRVYVEGYIGLPLSMILPLERTLYPLDGRDSDNAFLFGTHADQELFLTQSSIKHFLERAPIGVAIGGHFGYGANTYAVFIQKRDEYRRLFFRLPIGGIYMDNDKQAKLIREFLPAYYDFEQRVRDKVSKIIAVDSMLVGRYTLNMKDGRIVEVNETFFYNPDFNERFKEALE